MTLVKTFQTDLLTARKAKDEIKKNLLTALVGEAVMIGKSNGNRDTTDVEAVALVKKFIKNTDETVNVLRTAGKDSSLQEQELNVLKTYVPTQLSENELTTIINSYKASDSGASLATTMQYLKENYSGQYDGKTASNVAKKSFS